MPGLISFAQSFRNLPADIWHQEREGISFGWLISSTVQRRRSTAFQMFDGASLSVLGVHYSPVHVYVIRGRGEIQCSLPAVSPSFLHSSQFIPPFTAHQHLFHDYLSSFHPVFPYLIQYSAFKHALASTQYMHAHVLLHARTHAHARAHV